MNQTSTAQFRGKYYQIRSKLNGLVLDVENCDVTPGAKVSTHPKKPDVSNNQTWYDDVQTGTIRSRLNGFVLDVSGSRLCVNPYKEGSPDQKWCFEDSKIVNGVDGGMVLDIANMDKSAGAKIISFNHIGFDNQKWIKEPIPPVYFQIVSKMSDDKVLDAQGASKAPGTKVVLYDRNVPVTDNQLWFESEDGTILSKLNGFALDASGNGKVTLQPYDPSNDKQKWIVSTDLIQNTADRSLVLDVSGGWTWNNTRIIAYSYNGEDNQRWKYDVI